ncbi:MAG: DUF3305 domain-containing protein [Paracoccaceae bacterium]
MTERTAQLQVGVVVRKQPGVTRWADWVWRAVAVLPGAGPADWRELRREGEAVEYHAATCTLEVHRAEAESYLVALSAEPPSVYVVLRATEDPDAEHDVEVFLVTASAYEAQDYLDTGEDIVEAVPMPPSLIAWLSDFVGRHHKEEKFVKRRRDRVEVEKVEDGRGDERIRQEADVYRSPTGARRREKLH